MVAGDNKTKPHLLGAIDFSSTACVLPSASQIALLPSIPVQYALRDTLRFGVHMQMGCRMSCLHSASLDDLQAFVGIVFSAATYLLDFSSNIATAHEYHRMVGVHPSWIGIFIGMLSVMALAHILNAIVFRVELRKEEQPLVSAYLLPLVQLRRLGEVLWRTCSWKGLRNLKTDDKNTLYNILSVSLETGPQLTLQFVVFVLYYKKTGGRPPRTLVVSIVASFLSGTVNGGLAVVAVSYVANAGWRLKAVGFIISGLFTFSALLLQCLTYTVLMLWGWNNGYPIAGYVTLELAFYFVLFMVLLRTRSQSANVFRVSCNGLRFLHVFALSYLSAKIGALQPLTRDAKVKCELGKAVYWHRLLLVCFVHLCLYGGIFILCLVGPLHSRWSNLCPHHLSIVATDQMKAFPCGWYVPAVSTGMLIYSISVLGHIAMDIYVNRKLRIHQVLPISSILVDIEGRDEIDGMQSHEKGCNKTVGIAMQGEIQIMRESPSNITLEDQSTHDILDVKTRRNAESGDVDSMGRVITADMNCSHDTPPLEVHNCDVTITENTSAIVVDKELGYLENEQRQSLPNACHDIEGRDEIDGMQSHEKGCNKTVGIAMQGEIQIMRESPSNITLEDQSTHDILDVKTRRNAESGDVDSIGRVITADMNCSHDTHPLEVHNCDVTITENTSAIVVDKELCYLENELRQSLPNACQLNELMEFRSRLQIEHVGSLQSAQCGNKIQDITSHAHACTHAENVG